MASTSSFSSTSLPSSSDRRWVPHDTHAWVAAKVLEQTHSMVSVELDDGQQQTLPLEDAPRVVMSTMLRSYADLSEMEDFSEGSILFQIRKRFLDDLIYTYISTIVVAVNPYQMLPIYTEAVLGEYRGYLESGTLDESPPHVFGTAAQAFMSMCTTGKRQSVLISGESGAGKTETTKKVLYFLGYHVRNGDAAGAIAAAAGGGSSTADQDAADSIESKLMQSNPILEAFGNAKTVMNDNSSRFGKWMEISFDSSPIPGLGRSYKSCGKNGWLILGGCITSYILEKGRVSSQQPGERNFHVFYMLLTSSTREQRVRWELGDVASTAGAFQYARADEFSLPGRDERTEYQEMMQAFAALKFELTQVERILATVSAIMHLGNISFEEGATDDETKDQDGEAGPAAVLVESSRGSLSAAARLLQVNEQELLSTMLVHKTRLFARSRTSDKASSARDALAKDLYRRLFDYLVERINVTLGRDGSSRHQIGVLDIFGFEIFETNSFEQLCINYANESLQKHFNTIVTDGERKMYELEGVDCDHMDASAAVDDNRQCIHLIGASRMGVMSLLDDQVKHGSRASDTAWLRSMNYAFTKQGSKTFNRCYIKDKIRKDIFTVSHFAGPVTYSIEGFVEKNKDRLPDTMVLCMRGSGNLDLAALFLGDDVEDVDKRVTQVGGGMRGGAKRKKERGKGRATFAPGTSTKGRRKARGTFRGSIGTLGYKFKDQLKELQTSLDATTPHFIRCIKPNSFKLSTKGAVPDDAFNGMLSLRQLRYSGLFEVIRIRRAGFWFRYDHKDFALRYKVLGAGIVPTTQEGIRNCTNWRAVASKLFDRVSQRYPDARCGEDRAWAVGKTKVFLRSSAVRDAFEQLMVEILARSVCKIQTIVRIMVAKRRLKKMMQALSRLDAALDQMDQTSFRDAAKQCRNYPSLERQVAAAEKRMEELVDIIRKREDILKEMDRAVSARSLDSLVAVVVRAKDFIKAHPTSSFSKLPETEALIANIKREAHVIETLKASCVHANAQGEIIELLEDAKSLGSPVVVASPWFQLATPVVVMTDVVNGRMPLRIAIARLKGLQTAVGVAKTSLAAGGAVFEESKEGLAAPDLFRLVHHAENIGLMAETTVKRACELATSLTSAVDRRDIGELKVRSMEAEQALQEVGFSTVGVTAATGNDDAESITSVPGAIVENIPDELDPSVTAAVVSSFQPLLGALSRVRGVIVRLEQEWQVLQCLRDAMHAMDQRRLSSSLADARALKMSRAEHPDINKAEALLANLERISLLRARMRDLLERNNVGRDYRDYATVLAESVSLHFRDSIVGSLQRQYSALVLQLNFRKTFAIHRVGKLRSALAELSKHMVSQDIPSIIKAARRVQGLFQDDRPEVRHARYAIAFLRNKERESETLPVRKQC